MSLSSSVSHRKFRFGLVLFFLLGELALVVYAIRGSVIPSTIREVANYSPWSKEVVDTAAEIPVQDGGRVKPFSTLARFKMLSFHGSLKMKIQNGSGTKIKIGPTEWLLDCLFRPDTANQLPVFRVDDTEVLRQFGIESVERRDRLSYNDFLSEDVKGNGAREKIQAKAQEIRQKSQEEEDRLSRLTPAQKKNEEYAKTAEEKEQQEEEKRANKVIVELDQLLTEYEYLTGFLDFARVEFDAPKIPESVLGNDGLDPERMSTWVARFDKLRLIFQLGRQEGMTAPREVVDLIPVIERQVNLARGGVKWLPPRDETKGEWWSIGGQIISVLESRDFDWAALQEKTKEVQKLREKNSEIPEQLKSVASWLDVLQDMRALEDLVIASKKPNSEGFLTSLDSWRQEVTTRAKERGEGEAIQGETSYYKRNYFMNALVLFLIAFVVSAFGWITTEGRTGRLMSKATVTFFVLGLLYLIVGIFHRSLLMGRPPVGNLYDTIPFITAGAVLVLGISEWLTKRRLLLSLGSVLGVAGMFLAFRYEVGDATDHMDPLVAVLKSNYWLATHVVTITIGYSGGLMACLISAVYSHMRLAGFWEQDQSLRRFITRSVYGVTCFTLLFSLVGTVLGGIWANDSWGRFWGWDPKENGALLIVLWCLIILHARLAGWIKEWGLHLLSVLGGAIVGWSWWHVNMLEVGLHSYGFIKGGEVIWLFYGACGFSFLVGFAAWWMEKYFRKKKRDDDSSDLKAQT